MTSSGSSSPCLALSTNHGQPRVDGVLAGAGEPVAAEHLAGGRGSSAVAPEEPMRTTRPERTTAPSGAALVDLPVAQVLAAADPAQQRLAVGERVGAGVGGVGGGELDVRGDRGDADLGTAGADPVDEGGAAERLGQRRGAFRDQLPDRGQTGCAHSAR